MNRSRQNVAAAPDLDPRRLGRVAVSLLVSLMLAGCFGGLRVKPIDTAKRKPNNVWVFLTVQQGKEPVGGLAAASFDLYEDGKLVPSSDSKLVLQSPETVSVNQTLILLDLSGSIVQSGQTDALVEGVNAISK